MKWINVLRSLRYLSLSKCNSVLVFPFLIQRFLNYIFKCLFQLPGVILLLKYGALVNAKDMLGFTPLFLATGMSEKRTIWSVAAMENVPHMI